MNKQTAGIHHITAIVGQPQENVDFYAGILGLRLVKQTVNFDDPGTYHFYFGDEEGTPGTLITFFPWAGAKNGVIGDGQVGVTSYAIPKGTMDFWERRLQKFEIPFTKQERFGEPVLTLKDPHGLNLELEEREEGNSNTWSFGGVTPDVAIKGFARATLYSSRPEQTREMLEHLMGFEKVDEEEDYIRFRSSADIGNTVDVKQTRGKRGQMGAGTVHHIAFRAKDDADQLEWKSHLSINGYMVTPVQDRNYFNSIYFREHGDILFEIATDPPGFAMDESKEELGSNLKLPEQYESHREKIEKMLLPFEVRKLD